tara:strand:+ start:383 stop:556 length:174 start_codon:yes stop_codon:yes gene_type:complete
VLNPDYQNKYNYFLDFCQYFIVSVPKAIMLSTIRFSTLKDDMQLSYMLYYSQNFANL